MSQKVVTNAKGMEFLVLDSSSPLYCDECKSKTSYVELAALNFQCKVLCQECSMRYDERKA